MLVECVGRESDGSILLRILRLSSTDLQKRQRSYGESLMRQIKRSICFNKLNEKMAFLSPIICIQFILNIFMPLNWKGKYLEVDQEVHAVDIDIFQNNWNVFRDY